MTPEKILADVTEQPVQRPKDTKKRKKSYSGKKKMTTIKTEIVIEENGQILSISKSHRGKIHDFRIRKQEKLLPTDSIKYADSWYQGWQKLQKSETESCDKDKKYYCSERYHGSFYRSVQLPENADKDKISADFFNGVLSITIPKSEKQMKKIEIK